VEWILLPRRGPFRWLAIDGSAGGSKDESSGPVSNGFLQKVEHAQDIDARIQQRIAHRFSDIDLSRMVIDHFRPFPGKDSFDCRILDAHPMKLGLGGSGFRVSRW
jgi:hypothetical protein